MLSGQHCQRHPAKMAKLRQVKASCRLPTAAFQSDCDCDCNWASLWPRCHTRSRNQKRYLVANSRIISSGSRVPLIGPISKWICGCLEINTFRVSVFSLRSSVFGLQTSVSTSTLFCCVDGNYECVGSNEAAWKYIYSVYIIMTIKKL